MKPSSLAIFLVLALPLAAPGGEPIRFTAGPARVSLIELYTSEGCSSCPPAERWLAALRDNPGLWRDFVPVSFHVNYWDNLGWTDRLATPAFTQREYAYSAAWGSSSVYTPCFVRDGAEWKPGSPVADGARAPGVLTVVFDGSGRGRVEFTPTASLPGGSGSGFIAHVALLGGGLSSRVSAGENSGETLQHEFVALAMVDRPLVAAASDKVLHADFILPPPLAPNAARQALAVWITRQGELAPLQATGRWLKGGAGSP